MNLDIIQVFIEQVGEWVTLRRLAGPQQIPFDVQAKAFISGFQPHELVGTTIIQGDMKVILGAKEIAQRQWPAPPRKGDRIIIGGKNGAVEACETINIGDTICRYNLQVRGAQ